MRRFLIAMVLFGAPLCAVRAQSAAADSGTRIRVSTVNDARARNGTLISLTPDTLVYHPEFLLSVNRTPLDSVRAIEKSGGVHRSAHAALVGAGIGGLVGLGASALLLAAPSSGDGPTGAVAFVYYAPLLTAAGIVVGAYLGSEHRVESWSPIYPDVSEASMIVGPSTHNSFAFGLSVPYDVPLSIEDAPADSPTQSAEP